MNATKISFKGYDATPLKRIYVEERSASPFMSEIKQVGRAENVEISAIPSSKRWIQDTKVILEDKKYKEITSFEKFVLTLDFLFMCNLIKFDNGLIMRVKND